MKNQLKPMQTPAQPQLEVNHSEEKLTFKTSTISNVFSIVLLPIIPTITVLYLSKDMIISATTYGISLLFIVLFIFILKQEILVDSSGIKKSNKLFSSLISWSDLKSVSRTVMINDNLRYEFLTHNGVKTIPSISNHQKFEELFMKYGNMELYAEADFPINFKLKRWNKIGLAYEYTSALDRISDIYFKGVKPIQKAS